MSDIVTNTSGITFHSFEAVNQGYSPESAQECLDNARVVYNMFNQLGWSVNAVAAICGCMYAECSFNAGQKESSAQAAGTDGTGLLQWTRSSGTWTANNPLFIALRSVYGNIDNWISGEKQVNAIAAEFQQQTGAHSWGIDPQWYGSLGRYWQGRYGLTGPIYDDWNQWATSTDLSNDDMVNMFICCYLRPAISSVRDRGQIYRDSGAYYLEYLGGVDPGGVRYFPSTYSKGGGEQLEVIKAVQMILKGAGLYAGAIDGIVGSKTRDAMKKAGLN